METTLQISATETNNHSEIGLWQPYVDQWQEANKLEDLQAREAALEGLAAQVVADVDPEQLKKIVVATTIADIEARDKLRVEEIKALSTVPPEQLKDYLPSDQSGPFVPFPAPRTEGVLEAEAAVEALEGPANLAFRVNDYIAQHERGSLGGWAAAMATWIPALDRGPLSRAKSNAAQTAARTAVDEHQRSQAYKQL